MRLVILGDAHLISPTEPREEVREKRDHFANAWPSFRRLAARVRGESPDLIVSLGDIVDWYSDENADFALELMSEFKTPWVMTPGNHDFSIYEWNARDHIHELRADEKSRNIATAGWKARGVEVGNRIVSGESAELILVESAFSQISAGTCAWMREHVQSEKESIMLTHVPVDVPEIRRFIVSKDPRKDLTKYVMSGSPEFFYECVNGRASLVWSGHLHFSRTVTVGDTAMHLLGLSTAAIGVTYQDMGEAVVLDLGNPAKVRTIRL